MATRDDLVATLNAWRRRGSLRPATLGFSESWNDWLTAGVRLRRSRAPGRQDLIEALAGHPPRPRAGAAILQSRWSRLRALFRQGWNDERDEPLGLRLGASGASLLLNLLFAAMMLWLMYVRFMVPSAPEEETVRIRITGFGTPDVSGGGADAAEGDIQASAGSAASASAASAASASASTAASAASAATPASSEPAEAEAIPADQPVQVSETAQTRDIDYTLPPPRPVELQTRPLPEVQTRTLAIETPLPTPMPEVRSLSVPTPSVANVQVPNPQVAERALPTVAEPEPVAPQVRIRELASQGTVAAPQSRELRGRDLPTVGDAAADAGAGSPSQGSGQRSARTPAAGLPGASGQATTPGQQAAGAGVGPAPRTAQGGWPSPRRGDDWGVGDRNRAGAASGGDRGNPQGAGGSGTGLFNPDGSPRLADDRFKPRFPDPYKEGTWLKRPTLGYRGTMFDGIWRPPETLLQEWVRRGVKSVRIPIPGTNIEIECVVSMLQALGGCLPVGGKDGHFDQPARARPAPSVPFKPQLFENQNDLTTPKPSGEAKPAAETEPADQTGGGTRD